MAKTESWLGILATTFNSVRCKAKIYSTSTRVTSTLAQTKELKMAKKTNRSKIISWVVGLPAAQSQYVDANRLRPSGG